MNIDFETNPITLDEVVAVLGEPERKIGSEYVWQCPSCLDNGRDNFHYNEEKGIVKCFACDYGKTLTSIIARRRLSMMGGTFLVHTNTHPTNNSTFPPIMSEPLREEKPKEQEIKRENLTSYYWNCHIRLMKNKDILRAMYEKHTIMPKTASDCMIGYDDKKDMLVFPSKGTHENPHLIYATTPNGAEYREYKGEKNVKRIKGYDVMLCTIYGASEADTAIICEGYKDAYNLIQLLKITGEYDITKTTIFSTQNGTNSINHNGSLQKINLRVFKNLLICLDNDDAGNKATDIATDLYSKMIDIRETFLKGYNDIQERFKSEIAPKIDIDKALSAKWLEDYQKEDYV